MKGQFILAHDLGTTGDKATLFDEEGNLLASSFGAYPTFYPQVNWAEQNPEYWWKAFCRSTGELLKKARIPASEIACVCFSGQMMGCLPVDRKGRPLRKAIIWADQRGEQQADKIREKLGEESVYITTGHRISPSYSAAKIMWVKEKEPKVFEQAHKFLQAKDYIIFKLTGSWVTDYSDASGTNLFDLKKKCWSSSLLEAAGLSPGILPPPHLSTDIVGEVLARVVEETGLTSGTPVVIGGGDGPCASVGAGSVKEGIAYGYVGSSAWIACTSRVPVYDSQRRTGTFCHLIPDMYMPHGSMQAAGGSYQWLKENICLAEASQAKRISLSPYEIMNLEAENAGAGAGNLIFLPYLMGERSPYWNPLAKGAFIGLTLTHKRSHLIRAVLEGVVFNLYYILEILQAQIPFFKEVRAIGGAARSVIFRQIMADVFARPIPRPLLMEEATSLGAAITGGVGVGIFKSFVAAEKVVKIVETQEPNHTLREEYGRLYEVFKQCYEALIPVYRNLASLDKSRGLNRG